MKGANPYKLPPGDELDILVHELLFSGTSINSRLPYSTNSRASEKVKTRLKVLFGHSVIVGKTQVKDKPFFARFDTGPSTSTEVIAQTAPLAICRLAVLVGSAREKTA